MPDSAADYLRTLNTSDRARAVAWDAVNAPDDTAAEQMLRSLPFSDDVKAELWDIRKGATVSGGSAPTPAATEDFYQEPQGPEGSAVGRFVSNAAEMVNPVTAVKGLATAAMNPMDTARGLYAAHKEQFAKAKAAMGEGRGVEAAGHLGAGLLPVIGPAAAQAGEQIASGDVAGGMGRAAGLLGGAALAGPATRAAGRAVQPVAQRAGSALYQSALKPTKAVLKGVRAVEGPDGARRTLIDTGLKEGIAVSGGGAKKVESLIDSLNAEVESRLKSASAQGKTVDPSIVAAEIRKVADDFTDQINAQPDLAAIATVEQNFATNPNVAQPVLPAMSEELAALRQAQTGRPQTTVPEMAPGPIPLATAQRMKVNTYKGLRGKYGKEASGTIEAEKAGARALREQIETQAGPDVGALNAREGSLIPLEEAIADAMRRRGNYGIFGLTPIVASVPAVAHGNLWPFLAAMVDRMPGVVSRTGIWVNRVGTRSGRATQAAARLSAVGNATSPNESRTQATAPLREPFPATR